MNRKGDDDYTRLNAQHIEHIGGSTFALRFRPPAEMSEAQRLHLMECVASQLRTLPDVIDAEVVRASGSVMFQLNRETSDAETFRIIIELAEVHYGEHASIVYMLDGEAARASMKLTLQFRHSQQEMQRLAGQLAGIEGVSEARLYTDEPDSLWLRLNPHFASTHGVYMVANTISSMMRLHITRIGPRDTFMSLAEIQDMLADVGGRPEIQPDSATTKRLQAQQGSTRRRPARLRIRRRRH